MPFDVVLLVVVVLGFINPIEIKYLVSDSPNVSVEIFLSVFKFPLYSGFASNKSSAEVKSVPFRYFFVKL